MTSNAPKPTSSGTLEDTSRKRQKTDIRYNESYTSAVPYMTPMHNQYDISHQYNAQKIYYNNNWQYGYPYYQMPIIPQYTGTLNPQVIYPEPYKSKMKDQSKIDEGIVSIDNTSPVRSISSIAKVKDNKPTNTENVSSNSEDELSDSNSIELDKNEPMKILGTSISLTTDDEIAKWKEERRKMWLIKISNNKEKHRKDMNINDKELNYNPLLEARKEKRFISSIQSQVHKVNSSPKLHIDLMQRSMAQQNLKILDFIRELGDAKLLEYELTKSEKIAIFGRMNKLQNYKHYNSNNSYNRNLIKKKPQA